MKILILCLFAFLLQDQVTIEKHSGSQVTLKQCKIYQSATTAETNTLKYAYRGEEGTIAMRSIKRLSLKEVVSRKKGTVTYRVIMVKRNNDKLEVQIQLAKIEGINANGKIESMNFSSVDKISF